MTTLCDPWLCSKYWHPKQVAAEHEVSLEDVAVDAGEVGAEDVVRLLRMSSWSLASARLLTSTRRTSSRSITRLGLLTCCLLARSQSVSSNRCLALISSPVLQRLQTSMLWRRLPPVDMDPIASTTEAIHSGIRRLPMGSRPTSA